MFQWLQEHITAPIPTWYCLAAIAAIIVVNAVEVIKHRRKKRTPKRNPELVRLRDAYVDTLNWLYQDKDISWNTREKELRRLRSQGFDVERHLLPHPDKVMAHVSKVKKFIKTRRAAKPAESAVRSGEVISH